MQQVPKNEPETDLQNQNQLMNQFVNMQQQNENTQQRTQHDINNIAAMQQNPKTDSATLLTFQNLGKLAEFCATRGDY